ncbi:methionyl-tRNA formyltransferase, mitochondrial [Micropterus dolomieu]|uniref:methionyl-tRNA formyltransferase, mitochondrial n=1 Tax=Micropterus dolomieu TaxID=147949 RepID=UPI001E8CDC30|nr:methionyl-tRNA formyltransferase, mitochondrial [Micropterus dolomieu]
MRKALYHQWEAAMHSECLECRTGTEEEEAMKKRNGKHGCAYVDICLRCCVRTGWRTRTDGRQRRLMSSAGPPWRLLFFGSDHFAVESLKLLTSSRSSRDGVVESLEVVTLSGEVPVKRFAQQNHLPVHSWPPDNVDGQFDVGVVVSFGCLLPERLINKFPHGILNVHPSLLPRWRGPAPVFHTIIHGDTVTGVTIMQIRPHRFDVGPILNQEFHQVHENCTAEELGAALATKGAHLLIDTLMTLSDRRAHKREQGQTGATFGLHARQRFLLWLLVLFLGGNYHEFSYCAPHPRHSQVLVCEDYEPVAIDVPGAPNPLPVLADPWLSLERSSPLSGFSSTTLWASPSCCKARSCFGSSADAAAAAISVVFVVSSRLFLKASLNASGSTICVDLCSLFQDGWVGFKAVLLKKRLTAADFYNGYLHQTSGGVFVSRKGGSEAHQKSQKSML